jgi:hypothetical protein
VLLSNCSLHAQIKPSLYDTVADDAAGASATTAVGLYDKMADDAAGASSTAVKAAGPRTSGDVKRVPHNRVPHRRSFGHCASLKLLKLWRSSFNSVQRYATAGEN